MKDTGRSPDGKAMTETTVPDTLVPLDAGQHAASRAADAGDTAREERIAPGNKGAAPPLTPEIQNRIGSQLQSLYNDLLSESTPDRFLKLLEDLDRKS